MIGKWWHWVSKQLPKLQVDVAREEADRLAREQRHMQEVREVIERAGYELEQVEQQRIRREKRP